MMHRQIQLMPFYVVFSILFGLVLGSFLNVCIYRLPRGKSVATPARSYCPNCGRFISWYDNVPIISFLWLRGRCRHCRKSISIRYPIVEWVTALFAFLMVVRFGATLSTLFLFVFLVAPLIAITFIDLEHRIIPDIISVPGIIAGVLYNLLFSPSFLLPSVLFSLTGIAIGGGTLFIISWLYEKIRHDEGIGGGDIKLTAMLGAYFGWKGVFVILLLSSLAGSLIGLLLLPFQKKKLKTAVPFGPFLALAALLYLFLGQEIVHWYLTLTHRLY